MKNKVLISGVFLVLTVCCSIIIIAATQEETVPKVVGEIFQDSKENIDESVAAVYGDIEISMGTVEYYKSIAELTGNEQYASDRNVVNMIVRNIVLVNEAEERGLTATEDEINAQISATKQWYEENDVVKKGIDDFCAGAGISVNEYYEIIQAQIPATIARAKLVNYFQQESENTMVVNSSINDSMNQNVQDIASQELDRIVSQELSKVVYYVD